MPVTSHPAAIGERRTLRSEPSSVAEGGAGLRLAPESAESHPAPSAGEAPRARPASLLTAVASTVCAPVTQSNRIEPLFNGDQIFPSMLDEIRRARESVNFLTYVYWQGAIADRFAAALCDAAQRGVEVRVLIDSIGGARMKDSLVDRMRQCGCRVSFFNPIHWSRIRKNNWRTHRKILVVDGSIGFTGGVGIGEEWTGDAQDSDHWRDDHFRIAGPAVPYLQGAFVDNWRCQTGEMLAGERFYPRLDEVGEASILPVLGRPGADPSGLALSYQVLLEEAQRSVDLTTPYFAPTDEALEALQTAARRGVRVRLLVPGEHNDSKLAQWASAALLPGVCEAGVEIYRYQPTMIHSKTMIVDGRLCVVGSANYDCRSFELNHEFNLVVEEADFAGRMTERFEVDLSRSHRLSRADLDRLPTWKKIRNSAATLLRSQL